MKKGLPLIITAGIMWGMSCVFVNFFAPYGFKSGHMVTMRMLFAFLGLLIYCAIFDRKALKFKWRDLPLFILCGASMCATATFYYESMQLTSASTAVVLMYLSPVPIMLLSVLFLGEKFNLKKGIATGLMIVGCALVAGIVGGFRPNALGIVMGLLSAASYTVYCLFNKLSARRKIDPFSTSLYTFLFAAITALLTGRPWEMLPLIGERPFVFLPMFLLHSLVTCLLPYLFYTISLKYISVGVSAALCIIEPMTGALLGFLVYGDPLGFANISGIILIIAAVFLLGISEGGLHLRFPHFHRIHNNKRFHFFRRKRGE